MGSYGIGPGRVMGTIVELFSDEKGIIWPKSVAPFDVHLIQISQDKKAKEETLNLYRTLIKEEIEVLYDNRDGRAGEKFADSDLIGIPIRLVISDKTYTKKMVEVKKRDETKSKLVSFQDAARANFVSDLIK